MNISVIGLGKLGLCTAVCCARAGLHAWGMDNRKEHIDILESGQIPFKETGLFDEFVKAGKNLHLTDDIDEAISNTDITLIIVPTPSNRDGSFSNEHIMAVLQAMTPVLKNKKSFHVIDVVSTVMPGSCEQEFIPYIEQNTGKQVGLEIGLAYNPEFIAIGSVMHDFLNPDMILIGETDKQTGDILQHMYDQILDYAPSFCRTNLINAEIAKLCVNCYCTMKISFANNLAALCSNTPGADSGTICHILGQDSRIGEKYIKPGLGFGGPCFPRDNQAFIRYAMNCNGNTRLQEAVLDINNSQVHQVVNTIVNAALSLGHRIALLGLSYKPHTYLTECSQSLEIANILGNDYPNLNIRVFDPMAQEKGPFTQTLSLEECVKNANVAAVLTPWPEFMNDNQWKHLLSEQAVIINPWE